MLLTVLLTIITWSYNIGHENFIAAKFIKMSLKIANCFPKMIYELADAFVLVFIEQLKNDL